jgi:hypothetical protein
MRCALRLIQNGVLNRESIDNFAGRLGISGRHLGRLFAPPVREPLVEGLKTDKPVSSRLQRTEDLAAFPGEGIAVA